MADRQLHLGAFMRPVSIHTGWWRYPGAYPDANFNFEHLKRFARTLERGKFDAFFMADHLAVLNMPIKALRRSATVTIIRTLHFAFRARGRHRTHWTHRDGVHHV
jgi:alkanesulfonate monooxygenase